MARTSLVLLLLVSFLAALSNAFAPSPAFVNLHQSKLVTPSTELNVKIKIVVGDSEPIESAIRRFKREVNKSGHLMELRHRRYFENSQDKKKRKIKEARLRKKFERMQRKKMAQQSQRV